MNTTEFLDAVKARHGLGSDYALAALLGWTPQRVSNYRHRGRELDDDACLQVADALQLPAGYVMAEIAAERAKSAAAKRAWKHAAKLLKRGAAGVVLGAIVGGAQLASPAGTASAHLVRDQSIHYPPRRRMRGPGDRPGITPSSTPPPPRLERRRRRPRCPSQKRIPITAAAPPA